MNYDVDIYDLPMTVFNSTAKSIRFFEAGSDIEFYPTPGGTCKAKGIYPPDVDVVFTVERDSNCTIEMEFVVDGSAGPGKYGTENFIESIRPPVSEASIEMVGTVVANRYVARTRLRVAPQLR